MHRSLPTISRFASSVRSGVFGRSATVAGNPVSRHGVLRRGRSGDASGCVVSPLGSPCSVSQGQRYGTLVVLKKEAAQARSQVRRHARAAWLERTAAEATGRLRLRSMAYRRPGYAAGLLQLLVDGKQVLDDT
ncbi:hypothetical protein CCYA_CCYA04G1160 [Cyanidiococcus yangmingshanensis]|nr:hypothetical protein CCYA_CCYA04G1160 [Cyanidiococcus yangmingshanensis]